MEAASIENCFVCNDTLNQFKAELCTVTNYSERPLYQLIESFSNFVLSEEVLNECGVCQNCLTKFNEYDEFIMKAENIQQLIVELMETKGLASNETVPKAEPENEVSVIEDDPIEYEPLDELYYEEQEENTSEYTGVEEIEIVDPSEIQFQEDYQVEVVVEDSKENITEMIRSQMKIESQSNKSASILRKIGKSDEGFLIVELDNKQRVFQCDICTKTFKDKTKLKLHREIHTDMRNVICQECGKAFKTMNCLRNHKRTHLPERIYYGCDQCDKKYTQKVQLKKHIEIVHMNRRDYQCETCNASFGTKSVLKMHQLSHSDYRSETCEVCGFRVHTKAKLRRHMKSHTGIRDYNCGICGKKFLYSYNVIAHIRNVHEKKRSYNQIEPDYDQKDLMKKESIPY